MYFVILSGAKNLNANAYRIGMPDSFFIAFRMTNNLDREPNPFTYYLSTVYAIKAAA
jgi:hypothetical protein